MNMKQDDEIVLFSNWLKDYTHDVIIRVMENANTILENEFAMNLLRELYEREKEENNDFKRSIIMLFRDYEGFKDFDPHNHPITHSGSYRDILYDMFIRQ